MITTYCRHVNSTCNQNFANDVTGDIHIREGSTKEIAFSSCVEGARYE